MSDLVHKKVLLIAPRFFGYEKAIMQQLTQLGATVDFLADRPYSKPWQTGLTRIAPFVIQPFIDRFYQAKLDTLISNRYDLVFIINGQTLSKKILQRLKNTYPHAKFVLYLWDSVQNRPKSVKNFIFFDKVLTFDSVDARKYGIGLRALFFTPEFENLDNTTHQFDISFIATMHSDRYKIVLEVIKKLPSHLKTYWYFYLQAKWVFYLYALTKKLFRQSTIKTFRFSPIDKLQLKQVFKDSKAILDIEHPNQKGLTMRTLETLGANKKLITTNPRVKEYDFYKKENIFVIDRNNPDIPTTFWDTEYQKLPDHIYAKYTLKHWLLEVLS
jgi:hypothetical protein